LNSGCLQVNEIKNTTFIIDSNSLFAKTAELNMNDCLGKNISFIGKNNSSSLIISKDLPYEYFVSKGNLTIPHELGNDSYNEIITTDSTVAFPCF
ncbi:MAG: hypothetical protein ABIG89_03730, partial [Candidatus Woesearchaeota archaeon]